MPAQLMAHVRETIRVNREGVGEFCQTTEIRKTTVERQVALPMSFDVELSFDLTDTTVDIKDSRDQHIGGLNWQQEVRQGIHSNVIQIVFPEMPDVPENGLKITIRANWPDFVPENDRTPRRMGYRAFVRTQYYLEVSWDVGGMIPGPRLVVADPNEENDAIHLMGNANDPSIMTQPVHLLENGEFIGIELWSSAADEVQLPALKRLFENELEGSKVFESYVIVFIQHLLTDFVPFIKTFSDAGLEPSDAFIIGIPYSTKVGVVRLLRAYGWHVVAPKPEEYSEYLERVKDIVLEAAKKAEVNNKKLLIVEDGGYVSDLFRLESDLKEIAENCAGIVEQTTNGIWPIHEAIAAGDEINFCVINVAETPLKAQAESPRIGQAVVFNTQQLLKNLQKSIDDCQEAIVIGCGSIGVYIIEELVKRNCNVRVFDRDEKKCQAATVRFRENENITVEHQTLDASNSQLLEGADIIIGASGRVIIKHVEQLNAMNDGVILVNASSKRREFDWEMINQYIEQERIYKGFGHSAQLAGDSPKKLLFAASGFPVNFYGTDADSITAKDIEPVSCMLFEGAWKLANGEFIDHTGVIEFSEESQARIRCIWQKEHKIANNGDNSEDT